MNNATRREKVTLGAAALLASLAVIVAAYASRPVPAPQPKKMSRAEQVARGKYLVTIGGCNDCHTPWIIQPDGKPGPDMSRALSGHPMQFPIAQPAKLASNRWAV